MTIRNCTPHVINSLNTNGQIVSYPKWVELRVDSKQEAAGEIGGHTVFKTVWGVVQVPQEVEDFLQESPQNYIIVSRIAAEAIKAQRPEFAKQLLIPGNVFRDEGGNIKGCNGFSLD